MRAARLFHSTPVPFASCLVVAREHLWKYASSEYRQSRLGREGRPIRPGQEQEDIDVDGRSRRIRLGRHLLGGRPFGHCVERQRLDLVQLVVVDQHKRVATSQALSSNNRLYES